MDTEHSQRLFRLGRAFGRHEAERRLEEAERVIAALRAQIEVLLARRAAQAATTLH